MMAVVRAQRYRVVFRQGALRGCVQHYAAAPRGACVHHVDAENATGALEAARQAHAVGRGCRKTGEG